MKSKTKQIKERFGTEWVYDGINCWEEVGTERFIQRVKGNGPKPVHIFHDADGKYSLIELKEGNRRRGHNHNSKQRSNQNSSTL